MHHRYLIDWAFHSDNCCYGLTLLDGAGADDKFQRNQSLLYFIVTKREDSWHTFNSYIHLLKCILKLAGSKPLLFSIYLLIPTRLLPIAELKLLLDNNKLVLFV